MPALVRVVLIMIGCATLAGAQPLPPALVPAVDGFVVAGSVQVGGDDRWIAVAGPGQVQIFHGVTGAIIRVIEFAGQRENSYSPLAALVMAADPKADRIALLAGDLTVVSIDVRTGRWLWRSPPLLQTTNGAPGFETSPALRFSPDGEWVLVSNGYVAADPAGRALMAARLRASDGRPALPAALAGLRHSDLPSGGRPAWSADGHWLHVPVNGRGKTQIVKADSGTPVGKALSNVLESHAASGLAIVRGGPGLQIVDVRSGKRLKQWRLLQYNNVSFSPDGRRLLLLGPSGWSVLDIVTLAEVARSDSAMPWSIYWGWTTKGTALVGVQRARLIRVALESVPTVTLLGAGSAVLMRYEHLAWLYNGGGTLPSLAASRAEVKQFGRRFSPYAPRRHVLRLDGRDAGRASTEDSLAAYPAILAASTTTDGRWLAVRAADGQADVWDVATGNHLPFRLPELRCWSGPISARYRSAGAASQGTSIEVVALGVNGYMPAIRSMFDSRSVSVLDRYFCPPMETDADAAGPAPVDTGARFDVRQDGRLAIRQGARIVGHLVAPGQGDWLVTTPEGLFDGSPAGWDLLRWAGEGLDTLTAEAYFREFYQPGLLADLVDGRQLRPVSHMEDRDRRTPTIDLQLLRAEDDAVWVRAGITEGRGGQMGHPGAGVRDLRVLRNGRLVHAVRGDLQLAPDGTGAVEVRVPLLPGDNRLIAYAFNRDDVKSLDAALDVSLAQPPRTGVTYVLAVGINRYVNPEFNLKYAAPDATFFADALAAAQRSRGTPVEAVTLTDAEATKTTIGLALDRLAGRSTGPLPVGAPSSFSRLRAVGPNDSVIVYFAGHGISDGDRFHLIPADMAYSGPRNDVEAAIPLLLTRTLSDADLERAFDAMDARHLLLVIDACQSGQALELADPRPGPMNSRGLAQLAYDKGMSILTASQAHEAALESERLGHGYLTFALVEEGLRRMSADRLPADGTLTADEWFAHAVSRVPELQAEAMADAPHAGRLLRFERGARVQTPRVFARRDATGPAFVVAGGRPQ